jgi:hypothetical protein
MACNANGCRLPVIGRQHAIKERLNTHHMTRPDVVAAGYSHVIVTLPLPDTPRAKLILCMLFERGSIQASEYSQRDE